MNFNLITKYIINLFSNKTKNKTINFRYVNSCTLMHSEICKLYKLKQTKVMFMP